MPPGFGAPLPATLSSRSPAPASLTCFPRSYLQSNIRSSDNYSKTTAVPTLLFQHLLHIVVEDHEFCDQTCQFKPGSGSYRLFDLRQVTKMPSASVSLEIIIVTRKDQIKYHMFIWWLANRKKIHKC